MRAGLLTFYHIHHYGAALQAAAMERAVEELGGSCEIIDYYVNQDNALFRPPAGFGAAAADAHTALHYAALRRRYRRFEAFSQKHLRITPRRYESFGELEGAALSCDVLLSGSDQIWNPLIFPDRRFDPVFFGAFSPLRKIAYAPSFGLRRLPEGMEAELRGYLAAFSHLSARERAGQAIIREAAGVDAPVVLDPTLLLTAQQWAGLASRSGRYPAGGYILCYCISSPAVLEPYIRTLAKETGLPVVQLCGIRKKVHPRAACILDAGPAEFLDLFQNAAYVCTNSFHGTAFSVLFQKPFFTAVAPAERDDPENSRTFSLLSRLGLTNRIAGSSGTAAVGDAVNWEGPTARLLSARQESLAYLRAALQDEPYEAPSLAGEGKLPRLASRERCTGCTACAHVCPKRAIAMERDREGFLFPVVQQAKCIRCGRCTEACPALHRREPRAVPAVFAAWNRDKAVLRDSSSGGVFSALADYVLEEGGVVFGAALDGRQRVVHSAVFRKEDLWRLRGAKYVQSDLGEAFPMVRDALRKNRKVLFSGTPCQVDGLYRYLNERPDRLITCDLVCHGVPSPGVWEAMTEAIRQEMSVELRSVRFRDKAGGWQDSHLTIVYENGLIDSRPFYSTEYGRAFGRALFLRRSCYHCPYANLNRPGDFTLGDFWGLRPDELPGQQEWGVSLLLVNTAHGSHIFDQLPLGRQPFPVERAVAGNPRLASPTPRPPERDAFFSAFALEPFPAVRRRFLALPPWPVRAAAKLLTPELKAKLRRKPRP